MDVLVVGAGMAGNLAAKAAAQGGATVTVLEEHAEAGKFRKCTGIVSKKGLDSLGINYSPSVLHEVYGADLIAPNGTVTRVRSSSVVACVLERQEFDHLIAREAVAAGATYAFNSRATHLAQNARGVSVRTNQNQSFESKIVIGADGAGSQTAKMAGLPDFPASRLALCWEGEFEHGGNLDSRIVLVFMDSREYKGLFGWVVPVSETVARIGFGTTRKDKFNESKKNFLARKEIQAISNAPTPGSPTFKSLREFTYVIPLGPRPKIQKGRVWLVGDAAGQVKATTGGGIVFGGNAALLAGDLASSFVTGSSETVPNYESAWRKKYGRVMDLHLLARYGMDVAPNIGFNAGLAVGNAVGLGGWLSKKGDMDFFSSGWRASTRA